MDALITNECYYEAINIYNKYIELHDNRSHIYVINAYSSIGNIENVKQIHLNLDNMNANQSIELKNKLIDFYGKHGYIIECETLFNAIKDEEKTV